MNSTDKPRHKSKYELQHIENDYMLFRREDEHAVFVNETTALIWQLCNGQLDILEIQNLLIDSYPDAKNDIPDDVEEALSILIYHDAIDLV